MQFASYRTHKLLLIYVSPIILVLGTIGNTLSVIILTRPGMRRVSTYAYFTVLSVADTFVLLIGLLRIWLDQLTGSDIFDHSSWTCKFKHVIGYTASDYSVWLIIAMTVERYIAVCRPLHAPSICNRRRAFAAILLLLSFLVLLNCHFFWTTDIEIISVVIQQQLTMPSNLTSMVSNSGGDRIVSGMDDVNSSDESINSIGDTDVYTYQLTNLSKCYAKSEYEFIVTEAWPWLDAFVYSFVPFIVIAILNLLIIREVVRAHRARSCLVQHESRVYTCQSNCAGSSSSGGRRSTKGKTGHNKSDSNVRLAVMLLVVSITFLLTTLPMNVLMIVMAFFQNYSDDDYFRTNIQLARTVTELLMYTNHAINFFLYSASGEKFRRQIRLLFCCNHATMGYLTSAASVRIPMRTIETRIQVQPLHPTDANQIPPSPQRPSSSSSPRQQPQSRPPSAAAWADVRSIYIRRPSLDHLAKLLYRRKLSVAFRIIFCHVFH